MKKLLGSLVAIGILVFIGYKEKNVLLYGDFRHIITPQQLVQGASTVIGKNAPQSSHSASFNQTFQSIEKQINKLGITDIATASPQIQQILRDMQGLQKYPIGEAKMICQQICNDLH